jgi:hypothetical protein
MAIANEAGASGQSKNRDEGAPVWRNGYGRAIRCRRFDDHSSTIRRIPPTPPDSRRLFGDAWGTRDGPVTMLEQC